MSKEAFATDLMQCLEPIQDDCLCMDPPGESAKPVDHSDYCPVYLYDYCRRVAEGTANNPVSPADPAGSVSGAANLAGIPDTEKEG